MKKRNVVNKPGLIECKICNELFSPYGLPSHIKFQHNMTVDSYVSIHGEFRQSKLTIRKGIRNIRDVQCEICGNTYSIVGIATHLRDAHGLNVEQYIEHHSEYRPKYIRYNEMAKLNNIKCLICGEIVGSERLLSYHLKIKHNIKDKQSEYILPYVFNNQTQYCKCGCGNKATLINQFPYRTNYLPGHNPNGMTGKQHSESAKEIMSEKALIRIEEYRKDGQGFPWISEEIIEKRVKKMLIKNMKSKMEKYDVTILSTLDEYRVDVVRFKCNKCNTEYFQLRKNSLICTECNPIPKSIPQHEVFNYLKDIYFGDMLYDTRKIIAPLELDIYIPDKKIGIEFDGLYHHSDIDKYYHINKTELCEKQGIHLIHIFEDEWLYKQEIVKTRLKYILGLNENRIYARKCVVKEIDSKLKNNFLETYHIQGRDQSNVKLGLFYNDELVSVMTFGKLRIALGGKTEDGSFELIRFAINNNVVGGAGKLLKYFIRNYSPEKIISYADRRWSQGKLYETLGFTKVSDGSPNYWYTKDRKRWHRYNFTKHTLVKQGFDSSKTEKQIMLENKYKIMWDCGSLKYELNLD